MAKRCPNGNRRNKKTGYCHKKTGTALAEHPSFIGNSKKTNKTKKRCPNGTRKNKKTGDCIRKNLL